MSKKISMEEIANELNVSKTTVSRAFKDSTDISDELKKKILSTAQKMGYIYKTNTIQSVKNKNIGIIVNNLFNEDGETFYQKIYHDIVENLKRLGLNCILEQITNDSIPLFLSDNKVDGIIVLGQQSDMYLSEISSYCEHIILVDFESDGFNCVYTNNFNSTFNITKYLIDKGHTQIGFVGNTNVSKSVSERFFGFSMALDTYKLTLNPEHIIKDRENDNSEIDLILPKNNPSAYICNNDKSALKLLNKLKKSGYKIPDDISIVGYDDTIYSQIANPQITTAHVKTDVMALEAVRLLTESFESTQDTNKNLSITTELIERASVK